MRVPNDWVILEQVRSTQDVAFRMLDTGEKPGVVFAHHQSAGRGRFDRVWQSRKGDSLTFSIVFSDYAGHPAPWLIGMACAIGAARTLGSRVQWPNDLTFAGRKMGGILTEIHTGPEVSSVPVVGIGINLRNPESPELARSATSLEEIGPMYDSPLELAKKVVRAVSDLPEPANWETLQPLWQQLDETPGKTYRLSNGEDSTAIAIGPQGELIADVGGIRRQVFAADAFFGSS